MTQEIPEQQWKNFFDDLSKKRFAWATKVEVFNDAIGDQILDEGLPLRGITAETHHDRNVVEIMVGQDGAHHQTHTIENPAKIAYLADEQGAGGIVEIEEADGTKTLVQIIEPLPLVIKATEEIATA